MNSIMYVTSKTLKSVHASNNGTFALDDCGITGVTIDPREATITVHVLTLLASLVGNTLLITAFFRMNEAIMLLIANMAVSDLLVALFLIPRLITREVIGSNAFLLRGDGGTFLCKASTFLSDMSLSVSTQSLVLIAVERLLAVVKPLLYKKITKKIRRILIACTWIAAMVFHSPYFYTMRLVTVAHNGTNIQICQPNWQPVFDNKSAHLRYNIFLFVIVLVVPLLVIAVLYTMIVINQRRDNIGTCRSERGARRKQKRNKNLQRMAVATVAALLICWALYIVLFFLKLISPGTVPKCSKFFEVVDYISRVLASSYCAVNPCVCFVFINSFSRELSILCKRKSDRSAAV